ncbi:hypothetical protein GGR52DRAFT_154080 [Hypoxylon sp. FL1284]|nr:hypothetical protein GGR52DRAFT_154080 [Hypoxylon sp. FL1284]
MKTNNAILLLAVQAFSVLASPSPVATNADDCGSLGVMDLTQIPAGVDLSAVRKCLEHPLGPAPNDNASSPLEQRSLDLEKRDCWYGKPFGCTEGYCWKSCGDGPWCYTAHNDGFGDWYTCKSDKDCLESYPCGQKAGGDCASCGCSC